MADMMRIGDRTARWFIFIRLIGDPRNQFLMVSGALLGSCEPFYADEDWRRRRSCDRILQPHIGMLREKLLERIDNYVERTTRLTLLSCVAVHVRLQRTWSRESLVTDLALVLLLCAGGDLGAE